MVNELYNALRKVGVEDDMARAAARAVMSAEDRTKLATKADISELQAEMRVALADMKVDLIKWNSGLLVAMTAVFASIVKLL